MIITDAFANQIAEGDYVTSIKSYGNNASLSIGKVVGFVENYRATKRVAVVISSVTMGRNKTFSSASISKTTKLENIIKMHPDMIPQAVKDIL